MDDNPERKLYPSGVVVLPTTMNGSSVPQSTPVTQTRKPSTSTAGNALGPGAVAEIAIAGVLALMLAAVVIFLLWRRQRTATSAVEVEATERQKNGLNATQGILS